MTPLETIQRELLRAIGVGVALVDSDTGTIRFANDRFGAWFDGAESASFASCLPDLDLEAVRAQIANGGRYEGEQSMRVRRREVVLSVAIQHAKMSDDGVWLVECSNISRVRELEAMLDSYAHMVEKHTNDLRREKERVERLLLNIMPRSVYEEFKTFGATTPHRYESASILMLDFVGFTQKTVEQDPTKLLAELNDIFTGFDRVSERYGIERLKTIGDAYMAVAGVPEPINDPEVTIARLALLLVRFLDRRNGTRPDPWHCRVGIASGPVVGSVVGVQKYVYDIFGPPVNLATRLETLAEPMQVVAAGEIVDALKNDFELTDLGEHQLRGFPPQQIYAVSGG